MTLLALRAHNSVERGKLKHHVWCQLLLFFDWHSKYDDYKDPTRAPRAYCCRALKWKHHTDTLESVELTGWFYLEILKFKYYIFNTI
jgi:hypothetical protein